MNHYISAASVLAALALSMPMVSHAQDPVTALAQVKQLANAGKTDEAIQLCDKVIKRFGGKSTMAKQFSYVLPFYAWEKANSLFIAKRYGEAFDAFKEFYEEPRWKESSIKQAAKANLPANVTFEPYLTMALFQMGYCRYQQGVGTAKNPGDPAQLEEAIKYLEDYLELLRKGKVSAAERRLKIDGQICFLLVQANLLKPSPDFKAAGKYLEMSRKVKGRVPDDMAMAGLGTIVSVATKDPENVAWIYKIIESSPASYRMNPVRASRHAPKFLNYGSRAANVADKLLKEGKVELGADAVRSANALLSLVPDVRQIQVDLAAAVKSVGKYPGSLTDPATGESFNAARLKKIFASYKKLMEDRKQLEGFAVLATANTSYNMGSMRMAKAGYQVLLDRYAALSREDKKGELKPLRNTTILQLSQLSYATNNEEDGARFERMLEGEDMGDMSKNLVFNKMRRLLKEEKWEEVITAAEEVKKEFSANKANKFYASAQFSIVASYYKMNNYEAIIPAAETLLAGDILTLGSGKDGLNEKEILTYECQSYYFLIDAHMKMARQNLAELDKAVAVFEKYVAKYSTLDLAKNIMAPHMYYTVIDALLKKAERTQDEAAADALKERALGYCKVICDNWKDSDFYATAELLAANILIFSDDAAKKQEAINGLERCVDAALKIPEGRGKQTAANALYQLASYGPENPREGESDEALATRVKGYIDRFWSEADAEGNPFSLQMASLMMVSTKDKASFDTAVAKTREIIAREATYGHTNNKVDPELEKTINTYVANYVTGMQKYEEKSLTLAEKSEHFNNFPGIQADDKYTKAIFRMALLSAMGEELKAAKDDEEAKHRINNDIEAAFREMTRTFKPADLTSFICVQVGDYLVRYVADFPDPTSKTEEITQAIAYYQAVLDRNKEMLAEAKLGKANAMAFSKDSAQQAEAVELFNEIAALPQPEVAGPALVGLTKLYLRSGDAASAVKSASKYISNRANVRDRHDMLLMLGEAYEKTGDSKNALLTYMNLFNQNMGNITYSAPACKAAMALLWKRNGPATGERLKGTFKPSDRWTAWNTGQKYVDLVKRSGFEAKFTPAERDAFKAVENDLNTYKNDAAVQKEDKEGKDYQRQIRGKR